MAKIRKTAKLFVRLLIKEVGEEVIKKKKFVKLYQKTVENLTKGELKDELTAHSKFYIKYMRSLIQDQDQKEDNGPVAKSSSKNEVRPKSTPYDLYTKPNGTSLKSVKEADDTESVYNCFLHQQIKTLSHEKVLEVVEKHGDRSGDKSAWLTEIHSLCSLSIGSITGPENLHKVMSVFHRKLMGNSVEIMSLKRKRMTDVKDTLYQHLLFFHTCSEGLTEINADLRPSYEAFMASFLSVFIDMQISCCREQTEEGLQSLGRNLVSHVFQLLDRWPSWVLEVVLQLTNHHMQSAKHLLQPLLRKSLLQHPRKGCFKEYTKYMCAVRHINACMLNDLHTKVDEFVAGVPAPKHYLRWLREQDPSILDEIPETKHFKGVRITQFLYKDASEEVMESLLQLLSAEDVTKPGEEDTKEETQKEAEPQNESLYYFDETASADILDAVEPVVASTSGDAEDDEDVETENVEVDSEEEEEEELKLEVDSDDESTTNDDNDLGDILSKTENALNEVLDDNNETEEARPVDANLGSKQDDESESESEDDDESESEDEKLKLRNKEQTASAISEKHLGGTEHEDKNEKENQGVNEDLESKESEEFESASETEEEPEEPLPNGGGQMEEVDEKLEAAVEDSVFSFGSPKKTDAKIESPGKFGAKMMSPEKSSANIMSPGKSGANKLQSPNNLRSPNKAGHILESQQDTSESEPSIKSPVGKRLRPRKSFLLHTPSQALAAQSPAKRTRSLSSENSDKETRSPKALTSLKAVSVELKKLDASPKKSGAVVNGSPQATPRKRAPSPPVKDLLSPSKRVTSPSNDAPLANTSTLSKSLKFTGRTPSKPDGPKSPEMKSPPSSKKEAPSPFKDSPSKNVTSPSSKSLLPSDLPLSKSPKVSVKTPSKPNSPKLPDVKSPPSSRKSSSIGTPSLSSNVPLAKSLNVTVKTPSIPDGPRSPDLKSPPSSKKKAKSSNIGSPFSSNSSLAKSPKLAATSPSNSEGLKSPTRKSTPSSKKKPAAVENTQKNTNVDVVSSPACLTREQLKKKLSMVLGDVVDEGSVDVEREEVMRLGNETPRKSRRRTISNMSKESDMAVIPPQSPNIKYQDEILSIISSQMTPSTLSKSKATDRRRSMPAKLAVPLSPSQVKDTPTKRPLVKLSRVDELKSEVQDSWSSSESGDEDGSPGPRRSGRIRRVSQQFTNDLPTTPKKARTQPVTPKKASETS